MGRLFRLFRARQDGWRLFFDRIYSNEHPEFVTRPNALLAWAIEGRRPGARAMPTSTTARIAGIRSVGEK